MKKFFLVCIFVLLLCPGTVYAGYYNFSVNLGHTSNESELLTSYGFTFETPQKYITDGINWSLGYSFMSSQYSIYVPGPVVLGLVLGSGIQEDEDEDEDEDSDFETVLGCLLVMLIPEHITFHFWLAPKVDMAVSLHPWGVDMLKGEDTIYYSNGIGMECNYFVSTMFSITPFTHFRYLYAINRPVMVLGLKVGVSF